MSTATDAIEILQGALILADFLEQEERSQVLRRIQQLQRRDDDPRTFIAFVGEKKAGKSSLLKAITGVPLPTAVRECTAAVCLIQMGLDWHHLAELDSGEKRNFEALDDSQERRVLRLARRKDKAAAEKAITQIEAAEQAHLQAKQQLQSQETKAEQHAQQLVAYQTSLQTQQENLPFMWDIVKNFGWIAPKVRSIQENLDKTAEQIVQAEIDLEKEEQRLLAQRIETDALASVIPERWKEAKEAASISKEQVRDAKQGLQEIARANKDKFHTELHNLIDVEAEAAAQVEILTPNANIPVDVVLMDTPGFNTERPEHRRRAWEAIEERADICVLVSDIRQPMPETALKMLRRITPFCPFMHLALTKSDLALEEASILQDDPATEILEAKQVAQRRVEPYWDGEMNIWVVSAQGEQKQQSQKIFTQFWESLPTKAHELKSKKLSIHAIAEFIDILDIHILLAQDDLRTFDTDALKAVQQTFEQVELHTKKSTTLVQDLVSTISGKLHTRLEELEQQWLTKIRHGKTKSDIKLTLDTVQKTMEVETTSLSKDVEQALLKGVEQIAHQLIHDHPTQFQQLMSTVSAQQHRSQSPASLQSTSALWGAAGGLVGATTGLLLSGSLTGTLLLALGTGGITTILLSPLAEGKEKAAHAISESVEMSFTHMNTQLLSFTGTLEQECSRQIQDILQKKLEEQRTHERQNMVRKIQRMQDIQQRLEDAKFGFWPSIKEQPLIPTS